MVLNTLSVKILEVSNLIKSKIPWTWQQQQQPVPWDFYWPSYHWTRLHVNKLTINKGNDVDEGISQNI